MATWAIPFQQAQESTTFASSGVSIAERVHAVVGFLLKTCLTYAFHETARGQEHLISLLDGGAVHQFEPGQLLEIASNLESFVSSTDVLIASAHRVNFAMWQNYVQTITANSEKLDCIAESYRLSASEDFTSYVNDLVSSAEPSATEESWRDFVATLHD